MRLFHQAAATARGEGVGEGKGAARPMVRTACMHAAEPWPRNPCRATYHRAPATLHCTRMQRAGLHGVGRPFSHGRSCLELLANADGDAAHGGVAVHVEDLEVHHAVAAQAACQLSSTSAKLRGSTGLAEPRKLSLTVLPRSLHTPRRKQPHGQRHGCRPPPPKKTKKKRQQTRPRAGLRHTWRTAPCIPDAHAALQAALPHPTHSAWLSATRTYHHCNAT